MQISRLYSKLLCLTFVCWASLLSAQENRWTGTGGDNSWTNAANWSLGAVPDWSQDVVIEQTDTNGVVLDASAQTAAFTLGGASGSAILNIVGGSLMSEGPSVIGTNALVNLTGDLWLSGSARIDGAINWNSGSFETYGASVITSNGQLTLSGAGPNNLGGQLCNNGTISCYATNLALMSGCQFTNNSLLVLYTNLALTQPAWGFPYPGVYNNGTILAPPNAGTVTLAIGCNFDSQGTLRAETNAVLELQPISGSATLDSGTTFAGAGVVRLPGPGNYLGCFGEMQLDGTVELAGGSVFGGSVWSGPGLLRWASGSLGGFTFNPELQVDMVGAGDKAFEGSCTNYGTVSWLEQSRFVSGGGSSFNNYGQFVLQTNCTLAMEAGWMQPGVFTNLGTILAPAQPGTVTLAIQANFVNRGTLQVDANAVLDLAPSSGSASLESGTTFTGAGTVRFPSTGNYLGCFGSMQVDGTVELAGGSVFGQSVWSGPGRLRWESGSLDGFTFSPELQVDIVGTDDKAFEGSCINYGTVSWLQQSRFVSGGGSSFNNYGQFVLQTDCTLAMTPGWMQPGVFTNLGTILAPANNTTVTLGVQANFVNRGVLKAEANEVLDLEPSSGSASLESGTIFAGAGMVRFPGTGNYLGCFGSMEVDGTVQLAGGSVFGTSVWSGLGLFRWESGTLGGFTFSPELQVAMLTTGDKSFEGFCYNYGTVSWVEQSRFLSGGGSSFNNYGQFVLQTNCTLGMMPGYMQPGTFTNVGTILAPANNTTVTLAVQANFVNRGMLTAETNEVLDLEPSSGSASLESGTIIAGTGMVRLPGTGNYLGCFGSMEVDGTVQLAGGSVFGTSVWSGPGLVRWESGSLGSFTFSPDLHVDMLGLADKQFEGNCINQGTVRWLAPASFLSGGGSSLNNAGQFLLQTNCTLAMPSGYQQPGTVTNTGTIVAPAGLGTVALELRANFVNRGTVRAEANAVLDLHAGSGSASFEAGTVFDGAGMVRFPGMDSYLGAFGLMQVNGLVDLNGAMIYGLPVWGGPGLLRWESGGMNGLVTTPEMHVEVTGSADKRMEGSSLNQGTLRWLGDGPLHSYAYPAFNNSGLVSIEANCNWDSSIFFTNLAGGTLRQLAGQASLGTLNNSGTLELDAGTLSVNGCFSSPEATHRVTLGGYAPGADFGQLNAQTFSPGGVLAVTLTNGFVPTNGTSFVIATHGWRFGEFATTSLPSLPAGLKWQVQYAPEAIRLSVSSPVSGLGTLSAPVRLADGSFQFSLSGAEARAYEILVSTNLVDWESLDSNGPVVGVMQFTRTNACGLDRCFYRIRVIE
jgi:hypothetical protein